MKKYISRSFSVNDVAPPTLKQAIKGSEYYDNIQKNGPEKPECSLKSETAVF